jgi:hypothetical protein
MAVGSQAPYVPLAAQWDGTTWRLQKMITPGNAVESQPLGVSCTSSAACTAAGYLTTLEVGWHPLVERWNGQRWSIQHIPMPSDANNTPGFIDRKLNAVSCTSRMTCTAVGAYNFGSTWEYGPLVERWNGDAWSLEHTQQPVLTTGDAGSRLYGVSCSAGPACTAIGTSESTTARVPIAEQRVAGWPDSQFSAHDIRTLADGTLSFRVDVPGPGSTDVLETAWNDNLARTAVKLRPAPKRFVFARKRILASRPRTRSVTVRPSTQGKLLIAHHSSTASCSAWNHRVACAVPSGPES